jgi:di/tricarboxylate transporter
VQAALIGGLLMGALGCVDLDGAYKAVHWKTLVLIVGMLPFSLALERTGGIELAVSVLRSATADAPMFVVLGSLFLITSAIGLFISNAATAVLMAPVGLAMADDLQASHHSFAMIVALAASTAFMTPVSSPVNTMVVTPGRYEFGDFVQIGAPLSLIVMAVSVALVYWLLPPQ